MRYLPSHLMTCGSKVQRSNNYTPRQIYPTCSALWGCQIYIPDAATRLAQRSSLLVVFTRHWSAMISAAAWLYGKQIFSLANTTPISLKSDYQIWMTLLKKAGWRKTCRQHLHSIRGATRLAPSVAVTTSQNCNRLIKLSTRNCLHWLVWMRSICNCWFIAARGDWGSLFYSGILPRFRIMVCLKAVTTRYGILRNMMMRWRLRVLIAS